MANPNIVATTSIIGVTTLTSSLATGSGSTLVSSVTGNHVYKLNSLIVTNKSASVALVTIQIVRSGTNYNLAYQMPVPVAASLVIVDKSNPVYLQESDSVIGISNVSTVLDAIVSYEDIS